MIGRSSRVLSGGYMIVGSMAIIGLVDNFVRIIAEESGLWQFQFFRSIICCTLIFAYCLYRRQSIIPKRMWAVAIRAFIMSWALLLYFGSLTLMPIAEAGAALFTSPIFVLILSVLLFRTKVGLWRIVAVTVGFTGVLLVLRPETGNLGYLTFLPLFAGILYALGQLVTRHLCSEENTTAVMFGFFLTIGFFGLIGMILFSVVSVPDEWMLTAPFFFTGWVEPTERFLFHIVIQAFGSVIAVAGLIRGYQTAEPTYVAVFEYSFLIFAGFWGWVMWNDIPDKLSILGIVAIMAAGIVITLRSQASSSSKANHETSP